VFERELRKCVIFGRHNVVHDAPIGRIDLLTCRNLLIYLEAETQGIVLPRLHYALNREGYLFLGKAETQLARSALFRPVEMKHRIFMKVPQEWRRPLGGFTGPGRAGRAGGRRSAAARRRGERSGQCAAGRGRCGCGRARQPPARNLLGVGEADLGRPFQDLPISYRPMELRGPIDEVFRQRRGISWRIRNIASARPK
jgi:two-component system CheB/CheR fusion protein